jgi:hypothetical protein
MASKMNASSNSGREKAPTPKSVMVFKGIKGLVASGPGTKKMPNTKKLRPEKNEAAKIPQDAMKKTPTMTAAKPAGVVKPHGSVSVKSNIRPEPAVKRDSAAVVKPFSA